MRVGEPYLADGRLSRYGLGSAAVSRSVRGAGKRYERGFTLVELMITLAVAVVLIMIAVPSFKSITLSNKLTTAANDMVSALRTARMEAIKLNARTQFCSDLAANNNTGDTLGAACTTDAGAVFAITGAGVTPIRAGATGLVAPLQLNGSVIAVRFSSRGLGSAIGSSGDQIADICTSAITTDNHRIISMAAGSIVTIATTSGACPS
ncbi:MAG: GspH/FimT family pseudopilin [Rhodanobacter sp.]